MSTWPAREGTTTTTKHPLSELESYRYSTYRYSTFFFGCGYVDIIASHVCSTSGFTLLTSFPFFSLSPSLSLSLFTSRSVRSRVLATPLIRARRPNRRSFPIQRSGARSSRCRERVVRGRVSLPFACKPKQATALTWTHSRCAFVARRNYRRSFGFQRVWNTVIPEPGGGNISLAREFIADWMCVCFRLTAWRGG